MRIWVDADACPRAVKDMLYRAAERVHVEVVLVANQPLRFPRSRYVRSVVVGQGFDVADEYIVEAVEPGDLIITADVPLAAAAVDRGGTVIDPRGDIIDASNAAARLTLRNFMEQQRESGELMGGPSAYGDRDKRKFAGALDRYLARHA
ncbi:MAG TPA: YaiI/YqxD family protein [Deltaproteobacteria bacterium]|nr:YaiI/YqxD family protein [Deltaproteobacteria bacterium]